MCYQLIVSTLMDDSKMMEVVYPNCNIYVGNVILPGDLFALKFEGYDVIQGVDWLSRHYAQVD